MCTRIYVYVCSLMTRYIKKFIKLKYEQLIAIVQFESKNRRRHQNLRYFIQFNKIQEILLSAIFLSYMRSFMYSIYLEKIHSNNFAKKSLNTSYVKISV